MPSQPTTDSPDSLHTPSAVRPSAFDGSEDQQAKDPFAALPEIVLSAETSAWGWNLKELWRYRELGLLLAWRDVVIHYKQTVLGIAWAVLRPSLLTVIFALFLGRMVGSTVSGVPYALFVFVGLLPWMLFSTSISAAANSVVGSERLITKVYFPRLLMPLAAIGPAMVDFLCGTVLLLGMLVWYQVAPSWTAVLVVLPLGVALLCAAAMGAMLASMNVVYRDIRHALPFLIQAWMFATPAIYLPVDAPITPAEAVVIIETEETVDDLAGHQKPADKILSTNNTDIANVSPASARVGEIPAGWLVCNPLNACILFFRAALLGGELPWLDLGLAAIWGAVASLIGALVFHRLEATFADVV